jgi:hypothetical protein
LLKAISNLSTVAQCLSVFPAKAGHERWRLAKQSIIKATIFGFPPARERQKQHFFSESNQ